ncbi:hypothetical protein AVW11_32125 [Streptomyces amritsarensis]|uniref:Uncharacterized protein n=1 Tax=Streptomyces amritsarensis TaxID=681158 RepID=A0ABX3FTR0_9ACTN|nr:hypothetical protein AVW11_32125 [Streptomyces amritsarensis]
MVVPSRQHLGLRCAGCAESATSRHASRQGWALGQVRQRVREALATAPRPRGRGYFQVCAARAADRRLILVGLTPRQRVAARMAAGLARGGCRPER